MGGRGTALVADFCFVPPCVSFLRLLRAQMPSGPSANSLLAPLSSPALLPASPGFRPFGLGEGAELVGNHPGSALGLTFLPSPSRLGPSWSARYHGTIGGAGGDGGGGGAGGAGAGGSGAESMAGVQQQQHQQPPPPPQTSATSPTRATAAAAAAAAGAGTTKAAAVVAGEQQQQRRGEGGSAEAAAAGA